MQQQRVISDDPFANARHNPNNMYPSQHGPGEYRTARKQVPLEPEPYQDPMEYKRWKKQGGSKYAYKDSVGNELLDNPVRTPHRRRRRAVPMQMEYQLGAQTYNCIGGQPLEAHERFEREPNRPGLQEEKAKPPPRTRDYEPRYPDTSRSTSRQEAPQTSRQDYYRSNAALYNPPGAGQEYTKAAHAHSGNHSARVSNSNNASAFVAGRVSDFGAEGYIGHSRPTQRMFEDKDRTRSQLITHNSMMMPAHVVIDKTKPKMGVFDHVYENDSGDIPHKLTPNYTSTFAIGDHNARTKYAPDPRPQGKAIIHQEHLEHQTSIAHDMTPHDVYEGVQYSGRPVFTSFRD